MSNLKVRVKILVLAILMAIGMITISFQGLYNVDQTMESVDALYNENLVGVDISGDMRTQTRAITVRMLEMIIVSDDAELKVKQADIAERFNKIEDEIKTLEKYSESGEAKEIYNQIVSRLIAFKNVVTEVEKYIVNDDKATAFAYYKQNSNVVEEYQDACRSMNTMIKEASEELYQTVESEHKRTEMISIISLIAIGIISAVMVTLISNNIVSGFKKAVKYIKVLATGDFSTDYSGEKKRKDEVGELLESIVIMQDSIRNLLENS